MSDRWDLHCVTCDAGCLGDMLNHGAETLARILALRPRLETVGDVEGLQLDISGCQFPQSVPAFFAKHKGHVITVRSEYGHDFGDCAEHFTCNCCKQRVVCRLKVGHKGDHEPGVKAPEGAGAPSAGPTVKDAPAVTEPVSTANDGGPPDPSESLLVVRGWRATSDDMWTHPDYDDLEPQTADGAFDIQIQWDTALLAMVGYVVHEEDDDCGDPPDPDPERTIRMVEAHGECSFCGDRAMVAMLHGYGLNICGPCAIAACATVGI